MQAWVISHGQLGVLLGTVDGALIWSGLDAWDQDVAATFSTKGEARGFPDVLLGPFPGCEIVAVEADVIQDGRMYASIAAVEAAGLPGWDPTTTDALNRMPPSQD